MKRTVKLDPWFTDQPEMRFVGDLRSPLHAEKPLGFGTSAPGEGETDVRGICIDSSFPDPEGLLGTSYADWDRFAAVTGIAGDRFPVRINHTPVDVFESYSIDVRPDGVVITAGDTEGVRRALIRLEDRILQRNTPSLAIGHSEYTPRMRTRITRCFFSPINRPPKYGDELSDDIDYYPEEYLNRLMHDGINGVWIYTRFSDLCASSMLPQYGAGREARIEKLNRVIAKCRRYGIRPYVFAIEPVALPQEQTDVLHGVTDGGIAYNGNHYFCVNSTTGRRFVTELGRELFTSCPGLGGFISITYGERPTSCSSAYSALEEIGLRTDIACPRCRSLKPGHAIANAAKALAEGIHAADPDAEVISWTYGARLLPHEDVRDYIRAVPGDVISMQNFEEMGYAEQLGRTRQGVDYWLAYAGPSPLFRVTADEAKKQHKPLFMKTQVCCSHELATVPYVPVPGILFDKYRAAYECGVTGVMQCWYFGNYPSMMSRAAGELAFLHDFSSKRRFLEELAAIYWGRRNAAVVADAWEQFEAAYREYPLNIMFSYYGPMHDGPVWDLALKPRNFSLPRSWQTLDPADGDRIGECLLCGHTQDEAIELCKRMSEGWLRGLSILETAKPLGEMCEEQLRVARAISILLASGLAILRFYRARDLLGRQEGDTSALLREMRALVLAEIERSRALSDLCKQDDRLGYHSEGEGYKFFPKKLADRVEKLHTLLDTEFPAVERRISAGLSPLAYYDGKDDCPKAFIARDHLNSAEWTPVGTDSAFRAAYTDTALLLELRSERRCNIDIDPEFRLFHPSAGVTLTPEGRVKVSSTTYLYYGVFGETLSALRAAWQVRTIPGDGTHLVCELPRASIDWTRDLPFKLRVSFGGTLWCSEDDPVRTLGKNNVSPGDYGFLIPRKP